MVLLVDRLIEPFLIIAHPDEILMKKLEGATGSIDAAAAKTGQQVMSADNVNFGTPFLGSAAMEPNVVGHILSMKAGTLTKPMKGQAGVYMIQIVSFKEATLPKDFKEQQKQMAQQLQGRSQYEVFNALREKANITDNRGRFY